MAQPQRGRPKPSGGKHLRGRVGARNLKPRAGVAKKRIRPKAKPKGILDLSKKGQAAKPSGKVKPKAKTFKKPTQGAPVPPPAKAPGPPKKPTVGPAPKKAQAPQKAPAPPTKPKAEAPPPPPPEEPVEKSINWPKLVKALRDEWGFDQDQAAEDLGVSAATFKKWEAGDSVPGKGNQEKILAAMKSYSDQKIEDFEE